MEIEVVSPIKVRLTFVHLRRLLALGGGEDTDRAGPRQRACIEGGWEGDRVIELLTAAGEPRQRKENSSRLARTIQLGGSAGANRHGNGSLLTKADGRRLSGHVSSAPHFPSFLAAIGFINGNLSVLRLAGRNRSQDCADDLWPSRASLFRPRDAGYRPGFRGSTRRHGASG